MFTVLIKGVKSLGKAVWVTALFPYLILSILLVFSLSLDGAVDGIKYYITPNLTKLWDIQVVVLISDCSGLWTLTVSGVG